jgi:hypothetical protein
MRKIAVMGVGDWMQLKKRGAALMGASGEAAAGEGDSNDVGEGGREALATGEEGRSTGKVQLSSWTAGRPCSSSSGSSSNCPAECGEVH